MWPLGPKTVTLRLHNFLSQKNVKKILVSVSDSVWCPWFFVCSFISNSEMTMLQKVQRLTKCSDFWPETKEGTQARQSRKGGTWESNSVWFWPRLRHINQWDRKNCSEIHPPNWLFQKGPIIHHWNDSHWAKCVDKIRHHRSKMIWTWTSYFL